MTGRLLLAFITAAVLMFVFIIILEAVEAIRGVPL